MCGNRHAVGAGRLRLYDYVAANLMDFDVSPVTAQGGGKILPAQVTRELHPSVSISSRTR